jgi:hypothetical protein
LASYAQAFANSHLNMLFVFGDPGLGKSRCIRGAVGETACWIDGTASAFGIYCQAYEHRNQALVLDDVDALYRDRSGIRLLKALCQTDRIKNVSWQTNAQGLQSRGIPRRFTTTSRVAIIANQWKSLNADVSALEDRGHAISFEPTPAEVHRHAATWFWDQEVFDLVGAYLHLIARPSLRTYVLAYERKVAGLDWHSAVLGRCLSGAALAVAKLKADPSYPTEEDRVRAFVASGAGCRATYFNHAQRLRGFEEVPAIKLMNTVPPRIADGASLLDLLRNRFGKLGSG